MKRFTAVVLAAALLGAPAAGVSAPDAPDAFPKVLRVELEIRSLSPPSDQVGENFSFHVTLADLPELVAQRALLADLADRSALLIAVFERDEGGNGIPSYHLNHTRGLKALGGQAPVRLRLGAISHAIQRVLHLACRPKERSPRERPAGRHTLVRQDTPGLATPLQCD